MPRLDHCRQYLARSVESSGAVGPEALVELVGRNLQNATHLERAGVVDQDFGVAEVVAYSLEGCGDRVRVRGVGGDRERRTAVFLYVLPYLREAFFPARHHRDREAFAGEAPGDRSPESGADPEYRCHSPVHGMLLSSVAQAPPEGNSNSFRDSGFISAE